MRTRARTCATGGSGPTATARTRLKQAPTRRTGRRATPTPRTQPPEEVVLDQRQELLQVGRGCGEHRQVQGPLPLLQRDALRRVHGLGPQNPKTRPRGDHLLLGLPRAGLCGLLLLRGRPVALRALRRGRLRQGRLRAGVLRLRARGAAGDKTPEELTADPVFTGGLKRSIAEACDFAALGLSEDNIKDLVISYGRRRLEVDEAGGAVEQRRLQTAFSVTYTIVYDPDVVAISVDTIAQTVTAAAEEAIDEGSFITALDTAMAEVVQELIDRRSHEARLDRRTPRRTRRPPLCSSARSSSRRRP